MPIPARNDLRIDRSPSDGAKLPTPFLIPRLLYSKRSGGL